MSKKKNIKFSLKKLLIAIFLVSLFLSLILYFLLSKNNFFVANPAKSLSSPDISLPDNKEISQEKLSNNVQEIIQISSADNQEEEIINVKNNLDHDHLELRQEISQLKVRVSELENRKLINNDDASKGTVIILELIKLQQKLNKNHDFSKNLILLQKLAEGNIAVTDKLVRISELSKLYVSSEGLLKNFQKISQEILVENSKNNKDKLPQVKNILSEFITVRKTSIIDNAVNIEDILNNVHNHLLKNEYSNILTELNKLDNNSIEKLSGWRSDLNNHLEITKLIESLINNIMDS